MADDKKSELMSKLLLFGFLAWIPLSFSIILAPTFEVIIIKVFLKSIVRPFESVKRPSSKICNNKLNTSGCAFSTSSNNTTV